MENKIKFIVPASLCLCYMTILSCSEESAYKAPRQDTIGIMPAFEHQWSQQQAIPVIFYIEEEAIEPDSALKQ